MFRWFIYEIFKLNPPTDLRGVAWTPCKLFTLCIVQAELHWSFARFLIFVVSGPDRLMGHPHCFPTVTSALLFLCIKLWLQECFYYLDKCCMLTTDNPLSLNSKTYYVWVCNFLCPQSYHSGLTGHAPGTFTPQKVWKIAVSLTQLWSILWFFSTHEMFPCMTHMWYVLVMWELKL